MRYLLIVLITVFHFQNLFAGRESGGTPGGNSNCLVDAFDLELERALIHDGTQVELFDECGLATGWTGEVVGSTYEFRTGRVYSVKLTGRDEIFNFNAHQLSPM